MKDTKVVKFGGSSLADANQFKKVADIIHADKTRRFVVASAPGKRFANDMKITDMLYSCYEKAAKGESFDSEFGAIEERYNLLWWVSEETFYVLWRRITSVLSIFCPVLIHNYIIL